MSLEWIKANANCRAMMGSSLRAISVGGGSFCFSARTLGDVCSETHAFNHHLRADWLGHLNSTVVTNVGDDPE